jgi:hypothetical protein
VSRNSTRRRGDECAAVGVVPDAGTLAADVSALPALVAIGVFVLGLKLVGLMFALMIATGFILGLVSGPDDGGCSSSSGGGRRKSRVRERRGTGKGSPTSIDTEYAVDDELVGFVILGVMLAVGGIALVLVLKLLGALIGAAMILNTGSAPPLFQPFGGWVASLFATLAELSIIGVSLVIIWMFFTGRLDEMRRDDGTELRRRTIG